MFYFYSYLIKHKAKVRTSDPVYMERVELYFSKLLPLVEPLQIHKGGPIIMFQVCVFDLFILLNLICVFANNKYSEICAWNFIIDSVKQFTTYCNWSLQGSVKFKVLFVFIVCKLNQCCFAHKIILVLNILLWVYAYVCITYSSKYFISLLLLYKNI